MTSPINLNKARKLQNRAKKRAKADENAVKFGRTKAQKLLEESQADRARTQLDQHRRDKP
ncbi:MAG: DUF4169 family protein [Paracoccaceae bacterium]